MSDEQRERLLIAEQIERARAEGDEQVPSGSGPSESPPPVEEGLKREEGAEKVVLSLSTKPVAATTKTRTVGLKLNANPLKANPLKRPNVYKAAASSSTPSTSTASSTKRPAPPQSAAERLMSEDQERKRRKMEREAA
jgi:DNA/RNA-binding protein KIN17